MVFSKSGVMANMCNSPFSLAINTKGKRYICEPSQIRNGVFNSGLILRNSPKDMPIFSFDSNNLEAAIRDNAEHPGASCAGYFRSAPLPATMDEAVQDIQAALEAESDKVFCADSLEELAVQMGVDAAALRSTVEYYNRYCQEGLIGTASKRRTIWSPVPKALTMRSVPCWGPTAPSAVYWVNGNMQAYRADGALIPGLYVTGDFASGRFLNMGGVKVQVLNDMSWALASGFLAGTHVSQIL